MCNFFRSDGEILNHVIFLISRWCFIGDRLRVFPIFRYANSSDSPRFARADFRCLRWRQSGARRDSTPTRVIPVLIALIVDATHAFMHIRRRGPRGTSCFSFRSLNATSTTHNATQYGCQISRTTAVPYFFMTSKASSPHI